MDCCISHMKRDVEQEGVHVDSQFEVDGGISPGIDGRTDGNLRANAGEYIRYSMVVRNTGDGGGGGGLPSEHTNKNEDTRGW